MDALQLNDELLGTTTLESLNHLRPSVSEILHFVISVLRHRDVNVGEDFQDLALLSTLTRQTQVALSDIIISTVLASNQESLWYNPYDVEELSRTTFLPFVTELENSRLSTLPIHKRTGCEVVLSWSLLFSFQKSPITLNPLSLSLSQKGSSPEGARLFGLAFVRC